MSEKAVVEKNMNGKRLLKYIVVEVGILAVFLMNFFGIEAYYFATVFLGFGICLIYKFFKTEKRLKNIILAMLCAGTSAFLLMNVKGCEIWYTKETPWYYVIKIVLNIWLLLSICLVMKKDMSEKHDNHIMNALVPVISIVSCALYAAFALHITVDYFEYVQFSGVLWDFVLSLLVICVIWMLTNRYLIACIGYSFVAAVFSAVNHFVYEFRGTPIIYNDFTAYKTAQNVLSGYTIKFTGEVMMVLVGFVVLLLCMLFSGKNNLKLNNKPWTISVRIAVVVVGVVSFAKLFHYDFENTDSIYHLSRIAWEPRYGYGEDGVIKTIIETSNCVRLHKPSGYSEEKLYELEKQYQESISENTNQRPKNIIVIMNETWSDLSLLMPLDTNLEYNTFYCSMDKNVIKGNVLTSVWGGGTCNSEYEFLTGNSMWYTPGTFPYQSFINKDIPSLVSTMKSNGYYTTAIHPLTGQNWNREKVYDNLGFDAVRFDEIIENNNLAEYLMRGYLSDEGLYAYIENVTEQSGDQYNFIFAVTIQNHGDYSSENFENSVVCEDADSDELNQYLTLMRESDRALEQLISYYEDKEPTMIVMFGDHMPRFWDSGMKDYTKPYTQSNQMSEKEKIYMTPYFIWKNYGNEAGRYEDTSLNFLGTELLEEAGLDMPVYNRFLAELHEVLPAMNLMGCRDKDGEYQAYDDVSDSIEEQLETYKCLMYDLLHNKKPEEAVFYVK
ncbi:MAG: LTA synthase family protein [Eubacteriales bacterium]|nr:LTA synthase family protein [Eubacteriales bacterium]